MMDLTPDSTEKRISFNDWNIYVFHFMSNKTG